MCRYWKNMNGHCNFNENIVDHKHCNANVTDLTIHLLTRFLANGHFFLNLIKSYLKNKYLVLKSFVL